MGNGLLSNAENSDLRQRIQDGELTSKQFYLYLLRSIYRVLFLLVIEERNLIYPTEIDEETQEKRKIYYDYYSVQRLTKLAERKIYVDPRKTDLWSSLLATFALFEQGAYGKKLGIQPLGSGLFSETALGHFSQTMLNNEHLLGVLRNLVLFENENKQLNRVNYADLDVEEFGSVYEGLLEYDPVISESGGLFHFGFEEGSDRGSSGSHYTPEELVKPLIKHSLEYIIEDKLKEREEQGSTEIEKMKAQCDALLTITVCDVACGSGHILLSAARRIGFELAVLRESLDSRSKVEQPSPSYLRSAVRDVIRKCIYGVDLNPLAVELCKVALWLEAHSPGEPLNFLDHHIKNGNAIVGLAHFEELKNGIPDEAFKALPGDDKTVASTLRSKNKKERSKKGQLATYNLVHEDKNLTGLQVEFAEFTFLPERTPEEIAKKASAYKELTTGKKWFRLKSLADLQVAQFYIPKVQENKEGIVTEERYRTYLNSGSQISDRGLSSSIAEKKRFFHWFLEFPSVFASGGFDCILGNPPYKGDRKLKAAYGERFLEWIRFKYTEGATVDLVVYFLLRISTILKKDRFFSIITTNTVAQGKAREEGLQKLMKQGSSINHAVRSMRWPGKAAVEVSLLTMVKGKWERGYVLGNEQSEYISSYLDDQESLGEPFPLAANADIAYQGTIVLGMGFILEPNEAKQLIERNPANAEVIQPYLNGNDLNSDPEQKPSRSVINFSDWPLRRYENMEWGALDNKDRERIIKQIKKGNFIEIAPPDYTNPVAADYPDCLAILVERVKPERLSKASTAEAPWWRFWRTRNELYKAIEPLDRVLVVAQVSKTLGFTFTNNNFVLDAKLIVFALDDFHSFNVLQSTLHNIWAWKYCTTMKADLSYGPSNIFYQFPFPECEIHSNEYYKFRLLLSEKYEIGLTKIYNRLNDQSEESTDFIKFRHIFFELDKQVLKAYGWEDLIDIEFPPAEDKFGGITLHGFYEVEYLPENDRVRYTIHPQARKEILKRLLKLNLQRFEEEVAEGLHKRKDVEAYYQQKGKPIPPGTEFSDQKGRDSKKSKAKPANGIKDLFG